MARHLLDYNPATGEECWFDWTADENIVMTHTQPVDEILRQAHYWATKPEKTEHGMDHDLWHYARIPNVVIMEMKQKHGVDFFDENDSAKVLHLINTEYSQFKTTHKNHALGADKKYFIAGIKSV